jgi:hypothetical protein
MTTQLERIRYELELAGYELDKESNPDNFDDYANEVGKCAYEICKVFCNQGHSGMSASLTLQLIETLLKGETLTPLTNNPEEWVDVAGYCSDTDCSPMYQNKRNSACFSTDLKTYYNIYEETPPNVNRVFHKLTDYKEKVKV